ncbi:MAG: MmcQ/YjbR family DNA-binding protein [Salibacteraceae bacterium]
MNIEDFRSYCLAKPGGSEDLPFDENTLVFKVMGKMFALCDLDAFESVNLKCDPIKAVEYRERYEGVSAGYHMNKKHWNTVLTDGSVPEELLRHMINHSYELVVAKLPKRDREVLSALK